MKTGWDLAREIAEEHAQSAGIFIRLAEDGDKVVGVFCGAPHPRQVIWVNDRYEKYDARNTDHKGKRPSLRVSFNFYVPEEDRMKVIEGGVVWFRDVSRLHEKYGLETRVFEIQRNGASGSAKTTYSILPEDKVDDGLNSRINEHVLYDLEALAEGRAPEASSIHRADSEREPDESSESPLDTAAAKEIGADLKRLPRSEVDACMTHFGVSRISELTKGQESAVRSYLKDKLAKQAPAEEVDPFS